MSNQITEDPNGDETASNWGGLAVQEMLDEGYTLKQRRKGNKSYMSLRLGDTERSLGPFDQEKWDLFLKEFPDALLPQGKGKSTFLNLKLRRPRALGTKYEPSTEVLDWFFWFQDRGFAGKIEDFLNEVVHNYFVEQNLSLAVVINEGSNAEDSDSGDDDDFVEKIAIRVSELMKNDIPKETVKG